MHSISRIALATALAIGLGSAAMANTGKINMDEGNGQQVKQVTHTSMHTRTLHRRHAALRHRGHRWAMRRHFRGYGYAPMYGYGYGYGYGSSWGGASSSYSGNATETLGTSGSTGVNN